MAFESSLRYGDSREARPIAAVRKPADITHPNADGVQTWDVGGIPSAPKPVEQPPAPSPHSGEGSDSALEALKRTARTKPDAKENGPDGKMAGSS